MSYQEHYQPHQFSVKMNKSGIWCLYVKLLHTKAYKRFNSQKEAVDFSKELSNEYGAILRILDSRGAFSLLYHNRTYISPILCRSYVHILVSNKSKSLKSLYFK